MIEKIEQIAENETFDEVSTDEKSLGFSENISEELSQIESAETEKMQYGSTEFEFVIEDEDEDEFVFVLDSESDVESNEKTEKQDDNYDTGIVFQDGNQNERNKGISEDAICQLREVFPQLRDIKTVQELPNYSKFEKYFNLGLTATEAYAAANVNEINAFFARKNASIQGKSHLKSSVPRGVSTHSIYISAAELKTWRDTFPNLSDTEISALYKQTL